MMGVGFNPCSASYFLINAVASNPPITGICTSCCSQNQGKIGEKYHQNYIVFISDKSIECFLAILDSIHLVMMSLEQLDDDIPIDTIVFGEEYINRNSLPLRCLVRQ